ncbi:MAG: helix-turn-helix domain-containing protein [Planctomyces sp.]|nr:helix-turn-helix domain-containing protein [Planctomyces sp.]
MGSTTKIPELLTVPEVAELLRCSIRHVQRKLRAGEMEARKDGRRTLIPRWSVEAFLSAMPRRTA